MGADGRKKDRKGKEKRGRIKNATSRMPGRICDVMLIMMYAMKER